jgi:hypothetical protein
MKQIEKHFDIKENIPISRIAGFSDGLIAIIITLMVLEIPIPSEIKITEIIEFAKAIIIYFASFVVIGTQWNRHHFLLEQTEKVHKSFIWKNLLYLFSLSLIPLFMKLLIKHPNDFIPAIGYSLIYLITDFISIQLIISVLKNKKNKTEREEKLLTEDRKLITQILPLIIFSVSILLEYFLPNLTIIFFIIFPVTMSLVRAFKD